MAHLLGSKFCIESLQKDVTDLQSAVTDVFSRAGPVRYPSWKFPDKASCDIDIVEVLEMYDYSEEEEERQVSHVVLLELVIDRLVLLLQGMGKYLDQIISMGNRTSSALHQNTSVGLAVKKYWNKMIQLYTMVQQLQSEIKTKSRKINDLENNVTSLTTEVDMLRTNGISLPPDLEVNIPKRKQADISSDIFHKACQTYETAFVPCEACAVVQRNLREVGDTVSAVCKSQGLPCALNKFLHQLGDVEWLSANDIARWTAEQSKDLSRITKHLDQLVEKNEHLKDELSKTQKEFSDLQEKNNKLEKQLNKEQDIMKKEKKQLQNTIKNVEERSKNEIEAMEKKNQGLNKERTRLEDQLAQLNKELHFQKQFLNELETSKAHVEHELEESRTNNVEVRRLEKEMSALQIQLGVVEENLQHANTELAKEQAKGKSINKCTEALQSKQDSLLQRIGDLDQENEDLRNNVADLEESKEEIEEQMKKIKKEKKDLEKRLKEEEIIMDKLKEEKKSIEESINDLQHSIARLETQLQEANDKQKLLVEYPDLNGPVNPDMTGTGDIARDMQNQVKANQTRMKILEDQNMSLRHTITKVMASQAKSRGNMEMSNPTQLWKSQSLSNAQHHYRTHSNSSNNTDEDSEGAHHRSQAAADFSFEDRHYLQNNRGKQDIRKEKAYIPQVGPGRKAKMNNSASNVTNGSGITAYRQLKKSGLLKPIDKKSLTSVIRL